MKIKNNSQPYSNYVGIEKRMGNFELQSIANAKSISKGVILSADNTSFSSFREIDKVEMNKPIKKWVPAYYKQINGKKVYVRGHYITARFEYIETITKPVVINFKGKDGKLIKFNATKCIKKPLKVNFHKIKKEYKSK